MGNRDMGNGDMGNGDMGIRTTCIGAWPKPAYVTLPDWFSLPTRLRHRPARTGSGEEEAAQPLPGRRERAGRRVAGGPSPAFPDVPCAGGVGACAGRVAGLVAGSGRARVRAGAS